MADDDVMVVEEEVKDAPQSMALMATTVQDYQYAQLQQTCNLTKVSSCRHVSVCVPWEKEDNSF